ncbi:hypothetical protein V8F20_007461 [Naviculisporaceae sp. PSN 640]
MGAARLGSRFVGLTQALARFTLLALCCILDLYSLQHFQTADILGHLDPGTQNDGLSNYYRHSGQQARTRQTTAGRKDKGRITIDAINGVGIDHRTGEGEKDAYMYVSSFLSSFSYARSRLNSCGVSHEMAPLRGERSPGDDDLLVWPEEDSCSRCKRSLLMVSPLRLSVVFVRQEFLVWMASLAQMMALREWTDFDYSVPRGSTGPRSSYVEYKCMYLLDIAGP